MTRREQLTERYEDALFALLMDDLTELWGAEALEEQERLREDPAADVPPEARRRCIQTINRCFTQQRLRKTGRRFSDILRKVAVAALIAALLLSTVMAASPSLRTRVLNFTMRVFDDHTDVYLDGQGEKTTSADQFKDCEIAADWLPEGFSLEEVYRDNRGIRHDYETETGAQLMVQLFWKPGMRVGVDTEDAEVRQIEIQGNSAMLSDKVLSTGARQIILAWGDDMNFLWLILGKDVPEEDVVRVGESVSLR